MPDEYNSSYTGAQIDDAIGKIRNLTSYTITPEMDGTGSAGTSGSWARGNHVHPSDTSRCRMMTTTIPSGESVDIKILGTYYGPSFCFIISTAGNSGSLLSAWLVVGFGTRATYRQVIKLTTAGGGSISVTNVDGKCTVANDSSSYSVSLSVAILQEMGGSLVLSDQE